MSSNWGKKTQNILNSLKILVFYLFKKLSIVFDKYITDADERA